MTEFVGTELKAVTPDRWDDLVALFGDRGAQSGCWCMWWRIPSAQWKAQGNEGNRAAMQAVVAGDERPGILAYRKGKVVGWVSVGPRAEFVRLNNSPKLKPVDDVPVWSVNCFYIDRHHRGQGVATTLLGAAVRRAREAGAPAIEGYPLDPSERKPSNAEAYTGTLTMFLDAGFTEVERRGGRPIVRLTF